MQRQTQEVIARRTVEILTSGKADATDDVMRNPVGDYVDGDHLEREKSALFHRYPIVVGH